MSVPVREPSTRARVLFSTILGIAVATYVIMLGRANPEFVSDFDQVWAGARALWEGTDPYSVVGPGGTFVWKWPLYYPLPALLLTAPLGLVSVLTARAAFAAVSAALLAWAVTKDGWFRLPIFISVSFLVTMELGQWSALYTAAYFLPILAAIGVAKPNFGGVVTVAARANATIIAVITGGLLLLVISQLVQPGWHERWLENLRSAPHFIAPVQRRFGFLLLLLLLKWRRPEARWLLALSLVPQAPSFYDQLLLFVVCTTFRESLVLAASTVVLFFFVGFNTPQPDYLSWGRVVGSGTVWFCYLPALVMVLRRPNEGVVPNFVARFARRRRPADVQVIPG